MSKFNYTTLAVAIASIGAIGSAHAAGLDRSGQDVSAFLQDGTYAEAVYTYIDADISGKDTSGRSTGDVAEAYDFFRYGVKTDINDTFSVGILYDEPFGAAVDHFGSSNFITEGGDATVNALTGGRAPTLAAAQAGLAQAQAGIAQLQAAIAQTKAAGGDTTALQGQLASAAATVRQLGGAINAATTAEARSGQGTNVEIRTNNITGLLGAKFGTNKNFQIYGGPVAQRLKGEVHLRGVAYQAATGYDAKISTDTAHGWAAGIAYAKPEIALKAALTYRSEIEHESSISEVMPALGAAGVTTRDFSVTLPESWNLDFQTGINPTTLLTAKVRYVPWSDFDIRPPTYGDATLASIGNSLPIIDYSKDQWSGELGLAKKLSDKVAVSGSVGYDSGAGNPASSLGPIKGYYSVGLGGRYNFTPEWSFSLGAKYLKFGDATAQLPTRTTVGEFDDNDGFILGAKLAYHAK